MDEAVNRYARELIDAINAAVANDPAVRECRARARAAGCDLDVNLEVVGVRDAARRGARESTAAALLPSGKQPDPLGITAADRRFLRSLRIAPEESSEAPPR